MDRCSFCGREKRDTNLLIAGISGHICDSCIEQAHSILQEEIKKKSEFDVNQIKLSKPAEIKKFLDMYVIGTWLIYPNLFFGIAVAVLGMAFSLFNVFFQREKSDLEKGTMLIFAVGVTAGTAIWASDVMLAQSRGWLLIFPAWNAANGALLLFLFRLGLVDTSCIADLKASLVQIAVTIVSIAILVAVCQYVFRLHVAITFSIAVGYTMSLLGSLRDVFGLHPCDG